MTLLALITMVQVHAAPVRDQVAQDAPLRTQRLAEKPPQIDPSVYDAVEEGKVESGLIWEEGVKAGKAWGVDIWEIDVESAWMAINDQNHYVGNFNVTISEIVDGAPKQTDRVLFQLIPLPIVADRWMMVHQYHNPALYTASAAKMWELNNVDETNSKWVEGTHLEGALDAGIPVGWTNSGWLLTRLEDGRTLAEYYVWTDPGGSIPARPASRFAPGQIKRLMTDMEAFAMTYAAADRSGYVRPDGTPM